MAATMKVVGLLMVRNCEKTIARQLSRVKAYCDAIVAVDDRSTDQTFQLLTAEPAVSQVRKLQAEDTAREWLFPENVLLNLLYKMAEEERATWMLRLDSDEDLEPAEGIRDLLESQPESVAGIQLHRRSIWRDPSHPEMVPLMGNATSRQGAVWRGIDGLSAEQPMHNPRMPIQVPRRGSVVFSESPVVIHSGWDTLERRIRKVKLYQSLDPAGMWNHGVSYDRGLLFGYSFAELPRLVETYERKVAERIDSPSYRRDR
jgi:glycosyltransferase involved in cell wall biosynthesis